MWIGVGGSIVSPLKFIKQTFFSAKSLVPPIEDPCVSMLGLVVLVKKKKKGNCIEISASPKTCISEMYELGSVR